MSFDDISKSVEKEFINLSDNLVELDFILLKRETLKNYECSLELNLSNQLIMEIEPDAFKNLLLLESIDLSNNLISNLDINLFSDNKKLKNIDLSRNSLKEITPNLKLNSNSLIDLNLSKNSIKNLDDNFISSLSLVTLNLSSNKIERINSRAFHSIPNLSFLHLSNNNIRTLAIIAFKLKHLNTNDNDLEFVQIFSNALENFHCQNNYIRSIQNCIAFESQLLIELDLSNGKNDGIETVNENTFSNIPFLKILKINVNRSFDLNSVNNLLFLNTFHLVYKGETKLTSNEKTISDYFAKMNDFKSLTLIVLKFYDCYHQKLDRIQKLQNIHLECLKPTSSCININLTKMFMQNKRVENIFLKNLNAFKIFKVSATNKKVTISSFLRLKKLSLLGLNNETIFHHFQFFMFLEYLNLSDGKICEIRRSLFRRLTFLKHLYMDNCKLIIIKANIFLFNFDLETLSLSNNQIRKIEDKAFSSLKHLKFLDLRNNPLENLNKYTFYNLKEANTNIYFDSETLQNVTRSLQ